ncbi:hypothetical protein TRIP_B110040 [uncultured Desulfatiglans sp.]|uniref:Uncharacterized protein n=1 Tax=Uncultured Desulfatiglans sp. TaxID=1748965 RepID=A0A653A0C4_UNCDX|nr:hypothetical protein TRIP_B110040 [uncultured Desulfatiglans sp.]
MIDFKSININLHFWMRNIAVPVRPFRFTPKPVVVHPEVISGHSPGSNPNMRISCPYPGNQEESCSK